MTYSAEGVSGHDMARLRQAQKLAEILRSLILKNEWTERELARRSGIHPSSIQDYMDGITLPTKENREKLATVLGVGVDELDAQLGLSVAKPKRSTDELCRDIRLLTSQDFTIVAQVVLDRLMAERHQKEEGKQSD
jgi:transcriptional regulator with XRE-family HTH domain